MKVMIACENLCCEVTTFRVFWVVSRVSAIFVVMCAWPGIMVNVSVCFVVLLLWCFSSFCSSWLVFCVSWLFSRFRCSSSVCNAFFGGVALYVAGCVSCLMASPLFSSWGMMR